VKASRINRKTVSQSVMRCECIKVATKMKQTARPINVAELINSSGRSVAKLYMSCKISSSVNLDLKRRSLSSKYNSKSVSLVVENMILNSVCKNSPNNATNKTASITLLVVTPETGILLFFFTVFNESLFFPKRR
jgi:hypothetical protein